MQILQPLAVGNIGLAPWNILYVMGVDQKDGDSPRLQDLKQRDPVNSRALHRYGLDGARFQPVRRGVQVFREGRKTPHRLWISVPRHCDIDFRRPDIYTRSIRVQARQPWRSSCLLVTLSFPRHGSLSGFGFVHARRPRLCTRSTLLNEINVPWCRAAIMTELSTESGTTLLTRLPKDAPLTFSAYLPARMDRSFYRAMHGPQFLTFLTRAARVAYS